MATVTRPPTTTIADGWPIKVPNVAPHLNIGAGVDTPNTATYVRAGDGGLTNEYGGFFTAGDIPPGSVINSIKVRQYMMGLAVTEFPGLRFALKVGGVERVTSGFGADTGGVDVATIATFASTGGITRDELVGGTFSVSKRTTANPVDPPIPEG